MIQRERLIAVATDQFKGPENAFWYRYWLSTKSAALPGTRAPSPASPCPSRLLAPFESDPTPRFEPFVAGVA